MIDYACWVLNGKKGKWKYDPDEYSQDFILCGGDIMTIDKFWSRFQVSIIKLWEEKDE